MFYYIVIAFQAFCIFHVYKTKNEYFWYFVLFFVPVIGAIIYLFSQIINKKNIKTAGNKVVYAVVPNKTIKDLKKKLELSNTFQNKVNLADAYRNKKDFSTALKYYEQALDSKFKDEAHTMNKAVKCYFETGNYIKVIEYAKNLNLDKSFRNTIYIYAVSLEKRGYISEAEVQFRKTNKRYSNYYERLELAKFLTRNNKTEEAQQVVDEIIGEINNMTVNNKNKYKFIYRECKKLLSEL